MIRRPPRSTLFPYTRSSDLTGLDEQALRSPKALEEQAAALREALARSNPGETLVVEVAEDAEQDRKSTRLNSSHLVISYAVFCLKKKKKNMTSAGRTRCDTL